MCAFYEGLDNGRGIRVVPRALSSSLGDGLLCFLGAFVANGSQDGRAQHAVPLRGDVFVVGARPYVCPFMGDHEGRPYVCRHRVEKRVAYV